MKRRAKRLSAERGERPDLSGVRGGRNRVFYPMVGED